MTSKQVQLVFIDVPNAIPSTEDEDNAGQYGWWFSQPCGTFKFHLVSTCENGFPGSFELIKTIFKKEGPFDGVFSFSQGASLAAQLCVLQELGKLEYSFKFTILVAVTLRSRRQWPDSCPGLSGTWLSTKEGKNVSIAEFGETVIEEDMSEELLKYFDTPDIITHSGGHFVQSTGGEAKKGFVNFLTKMMDTFK